MSTSTRRLLFRTLTKKLHCKKHALDVYGDHTSSVQITQVIVVPHGRCPAVWNNGPVRTHGTHATWSEGKRRPTVRVNVLMKVASEKTDMFHCATVCVYMLGSLTLTVEPCRPTVTVEFDCVLSQAVECGLKFFSIRSSDALMLMFMTAGPNTNSATRLEAFAIAIVPVPDRLTVRTSGCHCVCPSR
jgi:hypothetical protein